MKLTYAERLYTADPGGNQIPENSPLVFCFKISPYKDSPRAHSIDTISIHCTGKQTTAERLCGYFSLDGVRASSNYVIGWDGRIGLVVEEKDRSWCTSSAENDNRAITIEVSSRSERPYAVTRWAYASLIWLCADICKRNGIRRLLWKGDKSLIGDIEQQNMTVHMWFANKDCPGKYLYSRHDDIARRVNAILASAEGKGSVPKPNWIQKILGLTGRAPKKKVKK